MDDLTVSENNNHLGTSVQCGKELCDKGMGKYQIKDKDER